jgi:hypothetical protein
MKKNILTIGFIIGLVVTLFSCKKDEEKEELVNATITIIEPTANDTVALNEEVHFEGTVAGTGEMHGYTVTFTNTSNSATLYTIAYDVHATSYNFHEHWINNVTDTTIVKATIDVTKDHDGNHEIKDITVVCLPQ